MGETTLPGCILANKGHPPIEQPRPSPRRKKSHSLAGNERDLRWRHRSTGGVRDAGHISLLIRGAEESAMVRF
jgi:hypothetical protein